MIIKNLKDFEACISEASKLYYNNSMIFEKHTLDYKLFKDGVTFFDKLESLVFNYSSYSYDLNTTWYFIFLVKNTLEQNENINLDFFMKDDSKYPNIRLIMLKASLYRDLNIFNETCFDSSEPIRIYSVDKCSYEFLKKCIKDKNKTVRLKAYTRLGPIDYCESALKDKAKVVRTWAIDNAPHFSSMLSKMSNEKSAHNFEKLISKVNKSSLPFFLSPSHLTSKNVSQYLKSRIKNEIKKRLS
jgi:hypothetical protein